MEEKQTSKHHDGIRQRINEKPEFPDFKIENGEKNPETPKNAKHGNE